MAAKPFANEPLWTLCLETRTTAPHGDTHLERHSIALRANAYAFSDSTTTSNICAPIAHCSLFFFASHDLSAERVLILSSVGPRARARAYFARQSENILCDQCKRTHRTCHDCTMDVHHAHVYACIHCWPTRCWSHIIRTLHECKLHESNLLSQYSIRSWLSWIRIESKHMYTQATNWI